MIALHHNEIVLQALNFKRRVFQLFLFLLCPHHNLVLGMQFACSGHEF